MFRLDDYEEEFEGLYPGQLTALQYAWAQLLDFAYSPYEPDFNEVHGYMQQIGRILGDRPPEALPFSGKTKVDEV